jgi:hypothetical protein
MLQWLYTYVSSVCSKYFICFRRTLQVFYLDVAKVDLTYVCARRQGHDRDVARQRRARRGTGHGEGRRRGGVGARWGMAVWWV